jgi:histidyl-tRNA synthetase
MKLKNVKGTRDILAEEAVHFRFLEDAALKVLALYGYREIRTPMFEYTELFAHGVGTDTDIVGKEMYQLTDRRGKSLALRPEGTAAVVRSVITGNLMKQHTQLRLYYTGPMFRYEQPQKGRFRQFYQIGAEYFGVSSPDADLELFLLLRQYFAAIRLSGISFQLNTIGCQQPQCRPAFKQRLIDYLQAYRDELCENCLRRLETNPLRVMDCKQPGCARVTEGAPRINEAVCPVCSEHFAELRELLARHRVDYRLNPRLVRGLDYYSQTVFEVYADHLGAQNAAGGGGRYDQLFAVYGAEVVPALGFALGLDRLVMLTDPPPVEGVDLFVVGHDRTAVCSLVAQCREAGFSCQYDPFQSSMKSQLRQANRLAVANVLILGDEEIRGRSVTVKDMQSGQQTEVPSDRLAEWFITKRAR